MSSKHEQRHRQERFARIRRAKWLLRFVPRRARFHRYPVIGRFADIARKRDHLWSFRTESVRPAIYSGSILALMPVLGIQTPIAFLLALLLRANVMVLIGLQFITTPITAPALYFATYHVGRTTMEAVGFDTQSHQVADQDELFREIEALEDESAKLGDATPAPTRRWTTMIYSLVTGGFILGGFIAVVLDLIWRFLSGQADARRIRKFQNRHSDSTPPIGPTK